MTDFELMGAALEEARKAAALGEVPVGAVVAKDGEIISAAHNTRETEKNALHHAELLAIDVGSACCSAAKYGKWDQQSFAYQSMDGVSIGITVPSRKTLELVCAPTKQ